MAAQKLDPYINVDPGTMSPYQHGEVYVTEDGSETNLRFWRLAAEENNTVILGCDAHAPKDLGDRRSEKKALALVKKLGLDLIDTCCIP